MHSIMIYLLLLSLTGAFYVRLQVNKDRQDMGIFYIGCLIFFARLFPVLMLEKIKLYNVAIFVLDLLITIYLYRLVFKCKIKNIAVFRFAVVLYILNPLAGIYIAGDNYKMMIFAAVISMFILYCLVHFCKLKNKEYAIGVFPGILGIWLGSYGIIFYIYIMNRSFKEVFKSINRVENVIFILSCVIVLSSCVLLILAYRGKFKPLHLKIKTKDKCDGNESAHHNKPDKFDYLIMLMLMLVFFFTAIYKLGTGEIPHTTYEANKNNNEIILDLGEIKGVVYLEIFKDYQAYQTASILIMDPASGQWELVNENEEFESCFHWNQVFINRFTRYVGIVCPDTGVTFDEIIILNENGETLLPVNATDYAELFDEQELYPKVETYYYQTMFDEIYHARTAYEFVEGYPIYETSHPPLGKSIIALGIKAFGMNPFGWRIAGVIAGTLCIPVMYLLLIRLIGQRRAGVLAGVLTTTEFMHFGFSRIATIDIFVALFIMLMFYFMLRYINKGAYVLLLLDGIMMGIGIATKWTAAYAATGIGIIFFIWFFERYKEIKSIRDGKKEIFRLALWCVLCFVIIPCVIYIASYTPFTKVYGDNNIVHALDNTKYAFSYHKDTVFEHPYSSEWYEWIWQKRPLLDAYKVFPNGNISTVVTMGSPLIVWGGLVALLYVGYLWRCKRDKNARFLVIMYLANLLPWMLIHRTVFIYHYFPCILTLVLITAYALVNISKKGNKPLVVTALVSVALFVMFYPRLSGMEVSKKYVDSALSWLSTWK